MQKRNTKRKISEAPVVLSGSELLKAIEEQRFDAQRKASSEEMVIERVDELVMQCLESFSDVLRPLGIQTGGSYNMLTDFSRDPQELYEELSRIQVVAAIEPRL